MKYITEPFCCMTFSTHCYYVQYLYIVLLLVGVEGASRSLTFGRSAGSTSCDIFSGFVFMVTNLRRDKIIEQVMDKNGVDETPPTEDEEEQNNTENTQHAQPASTAAAATTGVSSEAKNIYPGGVDFPSSLI